MAQLNLTLPDEDVEAIRAAAARRELSASQYVRRLALGDPIGDDTVRSLTAQLADQAAQVASLTRRLDDLEARSPWDAVEELQRRLEPVAEAFERSSY